MADGTTTNLGMTTPEVGSSTDTWGAKLNADVNLLDAIFKSDGAGTKVGMNLGKANVDQLMEKKVAMAAGQLDFATGAVFTKTISGDITLSVTNVAATGKVSAAVLVLTNGGAHTITWFSGVIDPGGVHPTLTASGVDALGLLTFDGGTTWFRFQLGIDMQ